jgi:methyl-accepting chemotaxis protein
MIIRFPTGLYERQIPQEPDDVGNVTYTISNEDPLTSTGDFIIFPIAERLRKRSNRVYTDEERRATFKDLVYSVSSGGNTVEGRSTKLFEVGQILEFTDENLVSEITSVSDELEIQHNTNLLDLERLGLSNDEISQVSTDSAKTQKQLEAELTATLNRASDVDAEIKDLQKTINEANKAISALEVLGTGSGVLDKIKETMDEAKTKQQVLIEEKADINKELVSLRDQIYSISELVR